jgi:hypothetical protein
VCFSTAVKSAAGMRARFPALEAHPGTLRIDAKTTYHL